MKRLVPFLLVCFLLWVLPAVALPQPWSNDPAALAQDQKDQKDKDKDEDEPKTEADKAKIAEMEKKACESLDTKYKTETDKSNHPTPKASADKD